MRSDIKESDWDEEKERQASLQYVAEQWIYDWNGLEVLEAGVKLWHFTSAGCGWQQYSELVCHTGYIECGAGKGFDGRITADHCGIYCLADSV